MEDIWAFLSILVWNWATIVYGALFAIEAVIRVFWKGYNSWAGRWLDTRKARLLLGVVALIFANYLAFHGVMNELRQLQSAEKRSARLTFVQTTSGGLTENGKSQGLRLHFSNTGSVASIGLVFTHLYMVSDGPLSKPDIDSRMSNVKHQADTSRNAMYDSEIQPTETVSLRADDADNVLMDKTKGSSAVWYLFGVLEYMDSDHPRDEWTITEICLEMGSRGTNKCPVHNRIYRPK